MGTKGRDRNKTKQKQRSKFESPFPLDVTPRIIYNTKITYLIYGSRRLSIEDKTKKEVTTSTINIFMYQ